LANRRRPRLWKNERKYIDLQRLVVMHHVSLTTTTEHKYNIKINRFGV